MRLKQGDWPSATLLLAAIAAAGCSSTSSTQAEKKFDPSAPIATTIHAEKVTTCEFKGNVRAILHPPRERDRVVSGLYPDTHTREDVTKIGGNTLLITGQIQSVVHSRPDTDKNFDWAEGKAYACPANVLASIQN
jgi:hypothetical protein